MSAQAETQRFIDAMADFLEAEQTDPLAVTAATAGVFIEYCMALGEDPVETMKAAVKAHATNQWRLFC